MKIEANTDMLLFRYRDYGKHDFILSHAEILQREGHVWFLKIGKRSDLNKIKRILNAGGWMILRAPKASGGMGYIAQFCDVSEETPSDHIYPAYYEELLSEDYDEDFYGMQPTHQWFKLRMITEISKEDMSKLVLSQSEKKVDDVIGTTRTAVMFVKNQREIII